MRAGRGWGRRRSGQGKDVDGCGRGAGRARRSGREGGLKHREGRVMGRGPLQVAWGSTLFIMAHVSLSVQPIRMRQRHAVHWSAGKEAGQTRRKADEREQGDTLQFEGEREVEEGQGRSKELACGLSQQILLPLSLDSPPTRSAAHFVLAARILIVYVKYILPEK